MLTFLSRWMGRTSPRQPSSSCEIKALPRHDETVAVGYATAFVAGQGARLYSLDAFRRHGRKPPLRAA